MVVMPKKTQTMQQKATQDATSGQKKPLIFERIKRYSRHKVRAVGTLVAATTIALALSTGKAKAQDITYASPIDSTKITAGEIPREGKPLRLVPAKGTNSIAIVDDETHIIVNGLSRLGVTAFDGNEKIETIKLKSGWNYVITNPKWIGAAIISNIKNETSDIMINTSDDGSGPISPIVYGTYDDILAIATEKGIILKIGSNGGYRNLTEKLNTENLQNPKIEVTKDKIKCTVSNSTNTAEIDLNTGTVSIASSK